MSRAGLLETIRKLSLFSERGKESLGQGTFQGILATAFPSVFQLCLPRENVAHSGFKQTPGAIIKK